MSSTFDLIILGGGCAGLSLATRLAVAASSSLEALVVESRSHYTNDRTWCFWRTNAASSSHCVEHQWNTMRLRSGEQNILVDCSATPYQMLPSDRFYGASLSALALAKNISLKLGTAVLAEPTKTDRGWRVTTSAGVFFARRVVDTRPQLFPEPDCALLWQSFYGQEIECDQPVFNPECMDLMHFLPPDLACVPFVYVLPMTATRALVELTVFGIDPLHPEDLAPRLEAAVAERVGESPFRVLRSEHGVLPMGLRNLPVHPDRSYVRAGLMAGGARSSTGFAFQRIQAWADACAKAVLAGALPIGHAPDPAVLQAMDHLFLKVMRVQPDKAGDLFCSLFGNADSSRVIRFLSGEGGLLDYLAVIAALPPWPFIKQLSSKRATSDSRLAAGQNG